MKQKKKNQILFDFEQTSEWATGLDLWLDENQKRANARIWYLYPSSSLPLSVALS